MRALSNYKSLNIFCSSSFRSVVIVGGDGAWCRSQKGGDLRSISGTVHNRTVSLVERTLDVFERGSEGLLLERDALCASGTPWSGVSEVSIDGSFFVTLASSRNLSLLCGRIRQNGFNSCRHPTLECFRRFCCRSWILRFRQVASDSVRGIQDSDSSESLT